MINHLNLTYFLAVCDELNFTKAAEKLYISQQALSNHIASIEKEVGITLFDRKPPMKLTYAGEVFYRYAKQMEDCYSAMLDELADIKQEKTGKVTIGISHTRGRVFLPKILPEYINRFPMVDVKVLEGNTAELTDALISGAVDVAIIPNGDAVASIQFESLAKEDIVLVIPDNLIGRWKTEDLQHIQEDISKTGKIRKMRNMPFLLNKKGNISRTVADRIFTEEDMEPYTLFETENIETLGEMCANGIGAAFYPRTLLRTIQGEGGLPAIKTFELDYECAHIEIAVAYNKKNRLSWTAREMINIIKEILQ